MALSHLLDTTPPSLLTTAARGGLRPAPDCRPRRALLHLSYTSAPSYSDSAFVTHDPKRNFWVTLRPILPLSLGQQSRGEQRPTDQAVGCFWECGMLFPHSQRSNLDGSEPRPQRTLPTRGVAGELHRCHTSALAGFRSQAGAFFILLLDAARCSVSAHRVHRAFPHAFSMWPARLCRAMAASTWFERVSLHAAAISGASCRLPAQGPDPRASTSCVRRQLLSRW